MQAKPFLYLLLIILLSSCAELALKNELSNLDRVKVNMSERDVVEILDEPNSSYKSGNDSIFEWTKAIVIFQDNKVVSKSTKDVARLNIELEALVGKKPSKRVATVLPSVTGMKKDDLEFVHTKKLVETVLIKNGYEISEDTSKIDTVVLVNFGISDPKTITKTFSTPVYDYVMPNNPTQSTSNYKVYNTSGKNIGTIQAETTYGNPYTANIPQQVYRGERTHSVDVTTYKSFLILDAVDYKQFNASKEIKSFWKVKTISESALNNLRLILPYMAMKVSEYIESESVGNETLTVYANDIRVKRILQEQRTPSSK